MVFYRRTNKKEYKSQIWKHNICYNNVITIQNDILIAKVLDGSAKKTACYWYAQYKGHAGMQCNKYFTEV